MIHLRRADDFAFDLNVGGGILHCDFGTFADAFLQNDHRSASTDGVWACEWPQDARRDAELPALDRV